MRKQWFAMIFRGPWEDVEPVEEDDGEGLDKVGSSAEEGFYVEAGEQYFA